MHFPIFNIYAPILSTSLILVIQVPILHFLVFKDPPRQEMFLRNKSCITPKEKYFILTNEDYQFKLGNIVKVLLSQEDSGMGFPILVKKNSLRVYPTKQLIYLKGYSGEGIPRLRKVLSKPPDVLARRQLARNAKCKATQILLRAMFAFCGNASFHDGQIHFATPMRTHSWETQNHFLIFIFSMGSRHLVLLAFFHYFNYTIFFFSLLK